MSPLGWFTTFTVLMLFNNKPTTERVVLLPSSDGRPSAITLQTSSGSKLLEQAYQQAEVRHGGSIKSSQTNADEVQQRYGELLAALPPRPQSYTVYFVSGSADTLSDESLALLPKLKAELQQRPAPEITVIGHTDRVGSVEANDALSQERANTVRTLLLNSGITALNIEATGRGEREPAVATADEVAEERNRRVEISVR